MPKLTACGQQNEVMSVFFKLPLICLKKQELHSSWDGGSKYDNCLAQVLICLKKQELSMLIFVYPVNINVLKENNETQPY